MNIKAFQPGGMNSDIGVALVNGTATIQIEPYAYAVEFRVKITYDNDWCLLTDEDNNPMSFYTYTEACQAIEYLVNELG